MTSKRLLINAILLSCSMALLEPTNKPSPLTIALVLSVTIYYFFDTLKTIKP